MGDDFITALGFCLLVKKYGEKKVHWLRTMKQNGSDYETKWKYFSFLETRRGDDNLYFYRDAEFKKYNPQLKYQKLSRIEELLKGSPVGDSWQNILLHLGIEDIWNRFDEILNLGESSSMGFIRKIFRDENDELFLGTQEKIAYRISHLYWNLDRKYFKSFLRKKDFLPYWDVLEKECAQESKRWSFISSFPREVLSLSGLDNRRVFLPVSLSKPEGYFIGDFAGEEVIFFHLFTDEQELNTELMAKRIKKLKSHLKRIFSVDEALLEGGKIYFEPLTFSSSEKGPLMLGEKLFFFPRHSFLQPFFSSQLKTLEDL